MRAHVLPITLLLAALSPAQAAVISERPDHVAVVVYNLSSVDTASLYNGGYNSSDGGLGLVIETRTVDLPAGPSDLQLRGVASTIVPQTAEVSGLPEPVDQRNFDYQLLTPGSLIEKSIGQPIHLIRTNRKSGETRDVTALVRSGPEGVLLQIGDTFEALNCSGLPERIAFDRSPGGLVDTPTLSVHTNVARAGRYTITLRYLAAGLNWSADYVARIAKDGKSLDLTGWITLKNSSETSFTDAPVQVVAGHLDTIDGEDTPVQASGAGRSDQCWPSRIDWATHLPLPPRQSGAAALGVAATELPQQVLITGSLISAANFGDYKLYALPNRTTVAAQQIKQVQFLNSARIPVARVYRATAQWDFTQQDMRLPASVFLRLQNTQAGRLGLPLPAGGASTIATKNDGTAILVGEEPIDDTPVGLPLELPAGTTLDVSATLHVAEVSATGARKRGKMQVTLSNNKNEPVTFEWHQEYPYEGSIISATRAYETRVGEWVWTLRLRPRERIALQYEIEELPSDADISN
jgi:hypothetical protein